MNNYIFKYNRGELYDGNYHYVNNLTFETVAASQKEAFSNFYNDQNIDRYDSSKIFEFVSIKENKLNPCDKMPHSACFDCQDCPNPI